MPQWLINLGRQMLSNDYVRAQVLAVARHLGTMLGTSLVAHGFLPASGGYVEQIAGLAVILTVQVLSQLDVAGVGAKMVAAVQAAPPPDTALKTGKF